MTSRPCTTGVASRLPSPVGRGDGGEGAPLSLKHHARALRASLTDAESALWSALRRDALGTRFRRQFVFAGRFILDFFAPAPRLAVEVDGGQHAESAGDETRTAFLTARGVTVLRFWNDEVLRNIEGVTLAIIAVLERLTGQPSPLSPLPAGGGKREREKFFSSLRVSFPRGVE